MRGDPATKIWRSADGRETHVEQMTVVHIWNTISMLQRRIENFTDTHLCPFEGPCPDCNGRSTVLDKMDVWLEVFHTELLRRGMSPEPLWDKLERANDEYNKSLLARRGARKLTVPR